MEPRGTTKPSERALLQQQKKKKERIESAGDYGNDRGAAPGVGAAVIGLTGMKKAKFDSPGTVDPRVDMAAAGL